MVKGGVITTAGGVYVNECLGFNLTKYFTENGFTLYNSTSFYNENTENYKAPADYVHIEKEIIAVG